MNERMKRREYLRQKIGAKCVICGRNGKHLSFHNMLGKPHPNLMRCGQEEFKKINLSEFVALCGFHHSLLHSLFYTKKVNTDNLVVLIRILAKGLKKDTSNGYTLFEDGGF